MPDWPNYLNQDERSRLAAIELILRTKNAERRKLMNRAKQRKHRATRA